MRSLTEKLEKKIKDKKAKIGIIGMGYVGIPLGLEFAGTGFSVTGFDNGLPINYLSNLRVFAIRLSRKLLVYQYPLPQIFVYLIRPL